MINIAVLTPDPSDVSFVQVWPSVLERLREALADGGVQVVPTPWTEHIDSADGLRGYALILPLLAWGYHTAHSRWLNACRTWSDAGLTFANPASVLAWNSDKRYLQRLADLGVPLPFTSWTAGITQAEVDAVFEATDAERVIVKPTVSGGAWKTLRLSRGEALHDAPQGAAMIQPYLPTIESAGETSLVFFGGRLSHVVNKRPTPGEFRIQVQFGGRYSLVTAPPEGAIALAERALATVDEELLYARVDVVPDGSGGWLLMELELIEPDFYLNVDPARGEGFAAAVHEWVGTRS